MMKIKNGYRCENCGRFDAKFEARIVLEGRNLLLCFNCLDKLKLTFREGTIPSDTKKGD